MPERPLRASQAERKRAARLLEARRRRLGITRAEMAQALGMHASEVSKILGGKAVLGLERAGRLAAWLGIGVDELLGRRPGTTKARSVLIAVSQPETSTIERVSDLLVRLEARARREGPLSAEFLSFIRSLLERGFSLEGVVRRFVEGEPVPTDAEAFQPGAETPAGHEEE